MKIKERQRDYQFGITIMAFIQGNSGVFCLVLHSLAWITLFLLDWGVDGVPELLIAALDGGGARHRGAEHRHPLVVTALAQGWAHQPPCKPLSGPAHKCPRQGPQRAGCGSPTLAPWAPSLASPPSTLSCQKCDLMCHIENQHHEVDFRNKSTNKKRFFV